MTKGEFLRELRGEEREVKFDESIVSAHPWPVAQAIGMSLEKVLPDEEIEYAVQTTCFEREGKLAWFLVLRGHVLALVAEPITEKSGARNLIRLTHQFHRRNRLSATLE